VDFKRAHTEEQRAERRRQILRTAAEMLTEMPVAKLSLNELSRRAGLAKSNVLRYFESREAVLFQLLDAEIRDWLTELDNTLTPHEGPPRERGDRLASILAESLARRPVLCDLNSAQASVLDHNVSTASSRCRRLALQPAARGAAGRVRRRSHPRHAAHRFHRPAAPGLGGDHLRPPRPP
jgi:AcrR family transcriptional regulator